MEINDWSVHLDELGSFVNLFVICINLLSKIIK